MKHTFPRTGVDLLLAHTKAATRHSRLYRNPATKKPGLWLVGDQGVYLVSNGQPALPGNSVNPDAPRQHVVYANEVNPDTMPFGDWWEAKRRGFGGDDGIEFIDAVHIEAVLATCTADEPFVIDIDAQGISLYRKVLIDKVAKDQDKKPHD
jgi:hypothetical protein